MMGQMMQLSLKGVMPAVDTYVVACGHVLTGDDPKWYC
jgi:hypothetical protein